ncbi:MAG: hypothetical protein AB9M53_09825 [Leptothrix sp. (in: b-proteobacteria)]
MNDNERADAPQEALRLVIQTRPHDVPAALLALSPVALVHYSDAPNPGVFVSSAFGSAEEVIDRIRSTIARQAAGRFWIFEAAQVLADAHGLIARQVLSSMVRAFEVGRLRVRKLGTGLSADPMQRMGDFVTPADVDAWLEAEGADYRFPPAPSASATNPAPSEPLQDVTPTKPQDSASVSTEAGSAGAVKASSAGAGAVRRTWRDVAGQYMAETLRAGRFGTAKELEAALRKDAGKPESPFDLGTGQHRGNLMVRDVGKPLTLKTVQNNWTELRKAAGLA